MHRWKDNIKMDAKEIGWAVDWTDVARDGNKWWAVVNKIMNLRVL
jgi:hypothetical protein